MDLPPSELHFFLRGYFHLKSADWDGNNPTPLKAWSASELAKLPYYYIMPLHSSMPEAVSLSLPTPPSEASWLTDDDLSVYVQEYSRNGFQGALNWYRVLTDPAGKQKDVEVFAGRKIEVPLLYVRYAHSRLFLFRNCSRVFYLVF